MKVKVKEQQFTEKEIDLEYPFYLYYQDSDKGHEEFREVRERTTTTIKDGWHGSSIELSNTILYTEQEIYTNSINREEYEHVLEEFKSILWTRE